MRTPTATKIRAIHYGIGSVGAQVARLTQERPDIDSVAAIDPEKAGQDLGEAAGIGRALGSTVAYDPEPILTGIDADVVLHTGEPSLTAAYPQILQAVAAGKNVISDCPELAFPWFRYADVSRRLDQRAREVGVAVLGAGANPGFVMDALPLFLLTACQQIKGVRVTRIVDITPQALEMRQKAGLGLSLEGFQRIASNGNVGLPGLRESIFMIAHTLGWRLDDISETLEPIVAQQRLRTDYYPVEKGYVVGLRHAISGAMAGRQVLRLEMDVSLGAEDPRDEIVIDGQPPIRLSIPGGLDNELATAAIMVNCIPAVVRSGVSGLLSMRDMPIAPYRYPGAPAHIDTAG